MYEGVRHPSFLPSPLKALRKGIAPRLNAYQQPRPLRKRLRYLRRHPLGANKPTLANDTFHTGKEKQRRPASNPPPPYRPTQTRPDTTSPPTTTW